MTVMSLHNYKIAHFWDNRRFCLPWNGFVKKRNDFFSVWLQSSGAASAMETDLGLSDVQLEASDLWIPGFDGQEYSHEQWLTRLACTLIESGFVQDEILLILSPMCKTKVTFDSVRFIYIMSSCAYELIWVIGNFLMKSNCILQYQIIPKSTC